MKSIKTPIVKKFVSYCWVKISSGILAIYSAGSPSASQEYKTYLLSGEKMMDAGALPAGLLSVPSRELLCFTPIYVFLFLLLRM